MVGVLFIVNVPQKEYEKELRLKERSSKIVVEKEKYEKASKVIHEMKKNKRFGTIKSSIESYATDDDSSIVISKCRSTDCLHRNDNEGLFKSKSENTLNDVSTEGGLKSSWEEVKQVIKAKRNKLDITRPVRGVDILGAFHWDTPLETILSEILTRLDINSASWTPTKGNRFWKVTFSLKSGNLCEELLQVLKTFGIGSRGQSSMSVLPCTLYYRAGASDDDTDAKEDVWQSDTSMWSQLSSSVRARNHLPQILNVVRAEASLTFDWLFLLVVAAFVAALGLVENSTVILVASMLISPLMGPITAGTLGTAVHDRSLQRMGLMHEMLGLFLSLVIGFIYGLGICAADERYGTGDWPTNEMVSRCEIRSLWVGVLVAIPSGAAVALAVLSEYTASLVGVAISASLLPPAVNAGLLWSISLVHLIYADDDTKWNGVITTSYYSENPAKELALLGTVSLCLTLVNIICIFLAGVAIYKIKGVSTMDKRDIPWWRANRGMHQTTKSADEGSGTWDMYSKWCNETFDTPQIPTENHPIQSDTVTYRIHNLTQRPKAHLIEDYCVHKTQKNESYTPIDTDMKSLKDTETMNSKNKEDLEAPSILSNADSIENNPSNDRNEKLSSNYYNYGYEDKETNIYRSDTYYPTIQPSSNLTIDAKNHGIILEMPSGVIFIVCIPSSNYEHILKFGKPRDMISIEDNFTPSKPCRLEVELRNKKSKSIPIYLTQQYYNEAFNPTLENITEDDEFFTMESILQELLNKLSVEHVVWVSDKMGNYQEVIFPLPTGDQCETMLHCLTQLGIGVRCKSIVNVLPCNVVHSALDNEQADEDTLFDYVEHRRRTEDAKRWRSFVDSIRSKLTVKQVVDGVRGGGELSFDYLTLIITADSLAALGLVENNASNIVAAMLVSPLMGPVMSITFGTIIADRSLVRSGFESLVLGMLLSLLFGFIFGLILGSTEMPWGFGDWPTEEMKARGNVRSLWMGVLWALTSGTGVALALLQGSAGPLIGIAISASLLPPVVNCGLYWALACIWLLYPGVKIPHIKGEAYVGNSSYVPLYHDYLPIEFAVNGIVSCCLTIVNVICIFITAIIFLKIKEVAAPYTSTPDLRRFWEQDIKVARAANRSNLLNRETDESTGLVLEDLNQTDEDIKDKLEAVVQEAVDDETYRKVQRMSYQSHNADAVIRTIGLHPRAPISSRSSVTSSPQSYKAPPQNNVADIAALDKILSSLLGMSNRRSSYSQRGTPRSSRHPFQSGLTQNRRSESWSERIFENTVVNSVLSNLKANKRNSPDEEFFLTPK